MEPPSALHLECPNCGRTPHRVLRGRLSPGRELVLEGVFRCLRCGDTRRETYREWAPVRVPLVVSDGSASRREEVELFPGEEVRVGDTLEAEGGQVRITAIEAGAKRVREAPAETIMTIWSQRVDRLTVKFSLNKGRRTVPFEVPALPEEEFEIGDLVRLGRDQGVIHRIKTPRGTIRDGVVPARDIVRVYCQTVRRPRTHRRPRRG
ncbi:MAG: HVO_0476 family zinc finger protein [Thermoplasmata archaeon]